MLWVLSDILLCKALGKALFCRKVEEGENMEEEENMLPSFCLLAPGPSTVLLRFSASSFSNEFLLLTD